MIDGCLPPLRHTGHLLAELAWLPYLADGADGNTSVLQFSVPGEVGGTNVLHNDRAAQCEFWARVLLSV